MRKLIPLSIAAAAALFATSGAVGYQVLDKTVELSVDGVPTTVTTLEGNVGEVLAQQGIALGEHDLVAPGAETELSDGDRIAVQYGRAVVVEVDGTEQTHWTTATTVGEALEALVRAVPAQGYLAVLAYLDRIGDAGAQALRRTLAERTGVQTTFGWGPRFLHSTGQYHKGGHPNGAFLELTAEPVEDLEIPGQPFSFGTLITAQAAGDLTVLADKGYPTLRLHLRDRRAGLAAVQAAAEGAPGSAARPRTTGQLPG